MMRMRQRLRFVGARLLLLLLSGGDVVWAGPSAEVSVLHHFSTQESQGRNPQSALCLGSDGLLYGTTPVGGRFNQGTAYRLAPDGTQFKILHHFSKLIGDGGAPVGPLVELEDGYYGQSEAGGAASIGTIYRIAKSDGSFTLLRSYQAVGHVRSYSGTQFDGKAPTSGLVAGLNGLLYGTTDFGGNFDQGSIVTIAPDGANYILLHSFRGPYAEGSKPRAGLVQTKDGFLYGTTSGGGQHNRGTVFKIGPDGSGFETIHHFAGGHVDGQGPLAPLIKDGNQTLYGVTRAGGSTAQGGAFFKINSDGTGYQMLRGFTGLHGEPGNLGNGLAWVGDQWLMGTSLRGGQHGKGALFLVSKDGSKLEILHHFAGPPADALVPLSPLIQAGENLFFGTSERGGREDRGTVYRVRLREQ